jgi:hypothetical protein
MIFPTLELMKHQCAGTCTIVPDFSNYIIVKDGLWYQTLTIDEHHPFTFGTSSTAICDHVRIRNATVDDKIAMTKSKSDAFFEHCKACNCAMGALCSPDNHILSLR